MLNIYESLNFQNLNFNTKAVSKTAPSSVCANYPNDTVSFSGKKPKEQQWYVDYSPKVKKEILDAYNNIDSQVLLGHGADGNTFLVKNIKEIPNGIVLKVSHSEPKDSQGQMQRTGVDFLNEKTALEKLPESMKNTQRIIGYIKKDENNYCLLTTFIEGDKIHPLKNPLSLKNINSMMTNLFELDKAGILHRDLKRDNFFTTPDGRANLIDYGASVSFDLKDIEKNSNDNNFPQFCTPSNIRNFEDTGLFPYLNELSKAKGPVESRKLFETYLQQRADFHDKKAQLLKETVLSGNDELKDAQRYEELQAKLFKKPSKDLVDLEALRIQMSSSSEDAYRSEVLDKNPLAGVTLKLFALINAKKFDLKIKEMQNKPQKTEMQEYLKFQQKLFDYTAKDKLANWTQGLMGWVMMNITGDSTQLHPEFLNTNIANFEIPDVATKINYGKK